MQLNALPDYELTNQHALCSEYIGMAETRRVNFDEDIPSFRFRNWDVLNFKRFFVLLVRFTIEMSRPSLYEPLSSWSQDLPREEPGVRPFKFH